jgi:ketosteroid isomerase-like protein
MKTERNCSTGMTDERKLYPIRVALQVPLIAEAGQVAIDDDNVEILNKNRVQAAFDAWSDGTGSVFDLLAPDTAWTIVGNSPVSRTFNGKQEFMDVVITPFNKRLSKPMRPSVRGIYADGNIVVARFDGEGTALDGKPYRNSYAWFMQMRGGKIVRVTAFFDTIEFTDLWTRIAPG